MSSEIDGYLVDHDLQCELMMNGYIEAKVYNIQSLIKFLIMPT